jgi:hypothetical protein
MLHRDYLPPALLLNKNIRLYPDAPPCLVQQCLPPSTSARVHSHSRYTLILLVLCREDVDQSILYKGFSAVPGAMVIRRIRSWQ